MKINDPDVVAEIAALFYRYDRALMDNDSAAMDAMFWDSPETVRYGPADIQHGAAAIRAQRLTVKAGQPDRRLERTVITTFGTDFATVNTQFRRADGGHGRQSQTWVRTAEGWRVVSAHVSMMPRTD